MILEKKNYREILSNELKKRNQRNRFYSLRAFARDLGISSSRLSEILRGKQGLSRLYALKMAEKIGFSKIEKEYFCDLVDSMHHRSPLQKKLAKARLFKYSNLQKNNKNQNTNYKLAPWPHLAILSLKEDSSFKLTPQKLSKYLDISPEEVKSALTKLHVHNLLNDDSVKEQSINYKAKALLIKAKNDFLETISYAHINAMKNTTSSEVIIK